MTAAASCNHMPVTVLSTASALETHLGRWRRRVQLALSDLRDPSDTGARPRSPIGNFLTVFRSRSLLIAVLGMAGPQLPVWPTITGLEHTTGEHSRQPVASQSGFGLASQRSGRSYDQARGTAEVVL